MVLSNQADGELESPSWPKHEKRARIEKNLTQACLTAFLVRRATPGSQSKTNLPFGKSWGTNAPSNQMAVT